MTDGPRPATTPVKPMRGPRRVPVASKGKPIGHGSGRARHGLKTPPPKEDE